MKRTLSSLLTLAAGSAALSCLAILGGCESGNSRALSAEQRAAATPVQHDDYAKLGYRVEWRGFPTMTPGEHIERLAILGDLVAVQESGSVVSVLENRSGERRWSDTVANPLTRFVGVIRDGKRVLVSTESEVFFYDVDTGALLNKQQLDQVVNTSPVQVGNILVYGCQSGQVLGHLMLNGYRQWGSYVGASIETDPVPVGADGAIALVGRNGDVLFLDGLSGMGFGRNRMFSGTETAVAASDTAIYIASTDHSLYCFRQEGAAEIWRVRTDAPLKFAPTFNAGRVYCDMGKDGLSCFDAVAGKRIWNNKDVHGTVVAVRNNRLIVWDNTSAAVLDSARGSLIDGVDLKEVSLLKTDKLVDGSMYLASPSGVVTKLVPRD